MTVALSCIISLVSIITIYFNYTFDKTSVAQKNILIFVCLLNTIVMPICGYGKFCEYNNIQSFSQFQSCMKEFL